jgi:hypothetical protein
MQIEFSREEFRTLLDMAYIADWIVNSRSVPGEKQSGFADLRTKIFGFAEAAGFGELIDPDSAAGSFYESKLFEDQLEEKGYVADYENDTFWDELASRLALKYLLDEMGEEALRSLSNREQFIRRSEMQNQIEEVFQREGLRTLSLDGFVPTTGGIERS